MKFCIAYLGFDVKAANRITLAANGNVIAGADQSYSSGNIDPIGPCLPGPFVVAQPTGSDPFTVLLGFVRESH